MKIIKKDILRVSISLRDISLQVTTSMITLTYWIHFSFVQHILILMRKQLKSCQ